MPVQQKAYVAVDVAADGRATLDAFTAPNDVAAARRALAAAEGVVLAVWRGGDLVGHWRRRDDRSFKPAPAEMSAPRQPS